MSKLTFYDPTHKRILSLYAGLEKQELTYPEMAQCFCTLGYANRYASYNVMKRDIFNGIHKLHDNKLIDITGKWRHRKYSLTNQGLEVLSKLKVKNWIRELLINKEREG